MGEDRKISFEEEYTLKEAILIAVQSAYSSHCITIANKLAEMKRIPRKLKKKYKKNSMIWNIVKEKKCSNLSF